MRTADECLKAAMSALLNGDLAERDRQCAMARHIMDQSIRVREGGPLFTEPEILINPPVNEKE